MYLRQVNFKSLRNQDLDLSESSFNVHDHLKDRSLEELKEVSSNDRLPWHTLCFNLLGDLNIGSIIRTSHCLGASSVIVFGRKRIDNRSLVGSQNYIKVEKIQGILPDLSFDSTQFIKTLAERNLAPVFIETGGKEISEIDWQSHINMLSSAGLQPCLVMGNESSGIPANVIEYYKNFDTSLLVSIPQVGVIRSLNVSIAHGIAAWHMIKEIKQWPN